MTCVFGENGCFPDAGACPNNPSHQNLPKPSASSKACGELGKFLQEHRELIASARRAFAIFIQAKDTYNTAQKQLEQLKTTNMGNVSQVFQDQFAGKLRNEYLIYLATRTGSSEISRQSPSKQLMHA